MSAGYTVLDLHEARLETSGRSGTPTAYLTEALGTTGVCATLRRLPPGRAMPYHRQDRQEELYLLLAGPGSMVVDGGRVDATPWTLIRVSPEAPRQLFNDAEEDCTWLVVGAPPVEDDGTVLGPGPAAEWV